MFRTKHPQKTIFDHDVYLPPERIEALHKTWAGPFRGKMVVSMRAIPEDRVAEALGLANPSGVLVAGVQHNGPAATAGLQPGDVILGLDGSPARNAVEIMNAIAKHRPGELARLRVDRQGQSLALEVEVIERPQRAAR